MSLLTLVALPILAVAAQAVPAPAPPADASALAPTSRRAGFTIEGSLGLGVTRLDGDFESKTYAGLSGLNLGLGTFLGPETALTLRIASTSYQREYEPADLRLVSGFVGPAIQHWVTDRLFVGGGLGLGVFTGTSSDDQVQVDSSIGFAVDLRVGYDVVTGARGALHVALEVIPSLDDEGLVTGVGLQVGAQLF